MKYLVRDCDPNTGEPDDDGYDDEYVVREQKPCVVLHGFNHQNCHTMYYSKQSNINLS